MKHLQNTSKATAVLPQLAVASGIEPSSAIYENIVVIFKDDFQKFPELVEFLMIIKKEYVHIIFKINC